MSEDIDITGQPIPKDYVKVEDEGENGSFLILKSDFDIDMVFPDSNDEEKYMLSIVSLNDAEFAAIPEFTGF